MPADIHYEVFVKPSAKASWRLVEAREKKTEALELAQAILKKTPEASVRVAKEKFDPKDGTFRSFTVFETGEKYEDDSRADREGEIPCRSPLDLCNPHARETIGRALNDWLKRQVATPLELLHRVDLVEKLEASGTEFQHAVQKVAIASASNQQANVQKFIKQINDLVQRAIEGLYAAHRAEAFPTLKAGELAKVAAEIAKGSNKDFRLRGAIAGRLKDAADWRAKLLCALDLADETAAMGDDGVWPAGLVGEYLVDLIENEAARAALLGEVSDLGDELDAFTDMVRGVKSGRLSDAGRRLAVAVSNGRFTETQRALARHVISALRAPKRLKPPGRIREEIALNRSLADRLILTVGRLVSQDELVEAFVYRSGRLLTTDAIDALLDHSRGTVAEVFSLIELEDNLVGDANKAKLAGYIRGRLSGLPAENHFLKGSEPPTQRLAQLAALRAAVDGSGLAASDKTEVAEQLDRFAVELESRIKLFDAVVRRAGGGEAPLEAAAKLLQLTQQRIVPKGRLEDEARARAGRLLMSPEGQAAVGSGDPAKIKLAQELIRMLSADQPEKGRAA